MPHQGAPHGRHVRWLGIHTRDAAKAAARGSGGTVEEAVEEIEPMAFGSYLSDLGYELRAWRVRTKGGRVYRVGEFEATSGYVRSERGYRLECYCTTARIHHGCCNHALIVARHLGARVGEEA